MSIIRKLRDRKRDMSTLSDVLADSLALAQRNNAEFVGAEHLMVAALKMTDGSARKAFERVGVDPDGFAGAIDAQRAAAVPNLEVPYLESPDLTNPEQSEVGDGIGGSIPHGLLKPDATYDAAIRATHDFHNGPDGGGPLSGAYLVAGVASVERGTAARALAHMDVDTEALIDAALAEARANQ